MPIAATRALLHAALSGGLDGVEYRPDEVFGFEVPVEVPGRRQQTARSPLDLAGPCSVRRQGCELAAMFRENFAVVRRGRRRPTIAAAGPLAPDAR